VPAFITVRVYVWVMGALVVLVSVTVGLALVELLRPVAGLQLYARPATGAAPSWAELPEQIVTAEPGAAAGSVRTVTTTVPELEQPVAVLVSVRVYVWVMGALVVLVSVTVGLALVELLRPVAGLQL